MFNNSNVIDVLKNAKLLIDNYLNNSILNKGNILRNNGDDLVNALIEINKEINDFIKNGNEKYQESYKFLNQQVGEKFQMLFSKDKSENIEIKTNTDNYPRWMYQNIGFLHYLFTKNKVLLKENIQLMKKNFEEKYKSCNEKLKGYFEEFKNKIINEIDTQINEEENNIKSIKEKDDDLIKKMEDSYDSLFKKDNKYGLKNESTIQEIS